ncbi:FkbM family methyltransferase [bacterium]|nr:MAG: FkbM family methyltransferase [bacterium]
MSFFPFISSSFHTINGDIKLSRFYEKMYYLVNNWNNRNPQIDLDPNIKLSYFNKIDIEKQSVNKRSPSRFMSDMFWAQLNWTKLKSSLGSLKIMDLGCGKGGYLEYWNTCSGSSIDNYIGFDIQKRATWDELEQKYPFAEFKNHQASSFESKDLDRSNVLFSQSVLEHIVDDIRFFKRLSKYLRTRKEPFIQIHLIPAASGLKKWQLHGVRQYTPRTVSRITRLFPDASIDIIAMGGEFSNKVHLDYITNPINDEQIDFRDTKSEEYSNQVKGAIKRDYEASSLDNPSFYALIIQHNSKIDFQSAIVFDSPNKVTSVSNKFNLSENSISLDLGANVGRVTQEMADSGATVYAFEPNPFAFAKLQKRFENNPKITCLNKAILDSEITIPLYFHELSDQDELTYSTGSSLLDFKGNVLKEKRVDVNTVDLAKFIKQLNSDIDLIKMDIEGVECKVINHLIDTGAIYRVKQMLVETHDHKIPELKEETDLLRRRIKDLGLQEKINLNWI